MNGAEIVLKSLKDLNVTQLFGYPGGAVIPLYDALYRQGEGFSHLRSAHEQGAVHAADGYARTTGNIGVCFVTSGPGATNTVTGIATAYMDSVPLVVISGQVPTSIIGKDSFQEIDITGMTMSITKHNYLVEDVDELEEVIKKACKIACEGRPGPVLIDIPKDVFTSETEYRNLSVSVESTGEKDPVSKQRLDTMMALLEESKKPVIYAGGGIQKSGAEEELLKFAEQLEIPVVNTLMGLGNFPRNHPLSLGLIGMHGFTEANLAIMNSDLIIAIGARFSDRVIGNPDEFAKDATVVHIDIDKTELDKNIFSDVKITGDAKDILGKILTMFKKNISREQWLDTIEGYKEEYLSSKSSFQPGNILKMVSDYYSSDTIVATDVGQHQMWTAQYWPFQSSKTFVTSGGLGTMGFGLGAAIGASIGNPDRKVVLVTGDGSFRMNFNELINLKKYNLPLLIVLFNNNTLGMVRQWQKMFQDQRYAETDLAEDIDYIQLANAFGVKGSKVKTIDELRTVLETYEKNEPLIVECIIDIDENVYPIIPPGKAINNFILK